MSTTRFDLLQTEVLCFGYLRLFFISFLLFCLLSKGITKDPLKARRVFSLNGVLIGFIVRGPEKQELETCVSATQDSDSHLVIQNVEFQEY